jgi:transposase-like protein
MNGKQAEAARRRRSRAEVEHLVAEYEGSGLGRQAFCKKHGLSLSTLSRHRKRQQLMSGAAVKDQWIAVELSEARQALATRAGNELVVALSSGRRIEVRAGFEAKVLQQLVRVLEQI